MINPEIPEEAVEAAVIAFRDAHSEGVIVGRHEKAIRAVIAAALPHLRVQETHGEICYNDGPPHPRTECHEGRCGLDPAPLLDEQAEASAEATRKAAALDDLMRALKEEWFTVDSGGWVSIDGSGDVSPETARVLKALGADMNE